MGRVFWDDGAVGVADLPAYVPCLILAEEALGLPEEDRDGPGHTKHDCSDDLCGHHFLFSKAAKMQRRFRASSNSNVPVSAIKSKQPRSHYLRLGIEAR